MCAQHRPCVEAGGQHVRGLSPSTGRVSEIELESSDLAASTFSHPSGSVLFVLVKYMSHKSYCFSLIEPAAQGVSSTLDF